MNESVQAKLRKGLEQNNDVLAAYLFGPITAEVPVRNDIDSHLQQIATEVAGLEKNLALLNSKIETLLFPLLGFSKPLPR